jgi:hypothetical protein
LSDEEAQAGLHVARLMKALRSQFLDRSSGSLSIIDMISRNSSTNCGPIKLRGGLSNVTRQACSDVRFRRICAVVVAAFMRLPLELGSLHVSPSIRAVHWTMQSVAVGWQVYALTGQALDLG